MSQKKTLVLGSGVSALAYLFYNPDAFALAGEQVGGLFSQARDLGPQYIWKTDSTTKLLKDMGYNDSARKTPLITVLGVNVGYLWDGKITRLEDLDPSTVQEIKKLYALKTRGIGPASSHMSSGKGTFEIYSLPVDELVAELLKRVSLRLIPQKAAAVDLYNQRAFTEQGVYDYDKLVSTVPAPVLLKLTKNESKIGTLKAWDKVYEKSPVYFPFEHTVADLNVSTSNGNVFDYIYVPQNDYPFHRVRWLPGSIVIREYTIPENAPNPAPTGTPHPRGQIIGGHEILESLPPDSVELLGRYAQWRHGIRLENVLETIQ